MTDVASNKSAGDAANQERGAEPTSNVIWPSFFPVCCPPADAATAEGVVLRLVRNDPPKADDFLPWSVENGRVDKSKPCQSCAVSVFESLDDVRKMQRRVPAQRPKPVAQGELKSEMGVAKPTGPKQGSHRSWWLPDGIDPSPAFRVIAPAFQMGGV
jgi:hypothetical protein